MSEINENVLKEVDALVKKGLVALDEFREL